jgi:hypothetical protein
MTAKSASPVLGGAEVTGQRQQGRHPVDGGKLVILPE